MIYSKSYAKGMQKACKRPLSARFGGLAMAESMVFGSETAGPLHSALLESSSGSLLKGPACDIA